MADREHRIMAHFAEVHPKMNRAARAYKRCKKHLSENRVNDLSDPELLADIHKRTHERFDDSARQATINTMGQGH